MGFRQPVRSWCRDPQTGRSGCGAPVGFNRRRSAGPTQKGRPRRTPMRSLQSDVPARLRLRRIGPCKKTWVGFGAPTSFFDDDHHGTPVLELRIIAPITRAQGHFARDTQGFGAPSPEQRLGRRFGRRERHCPHCLSSVVTTLYRLTCVRDDWMQFNGRFLPLRSHDQAGLHVEQARQPACQAGESFAGRAWVHACLLVSRGAGGMGGEKEALLF